MYLLITARIPLLLLALLCLTPAARASADLNPAHALGIPDTKRPSYVAAPKPTMPRYWARFLIKCPPPPFPPQALEKKIRGEVIVLIVVRNGQIIEMKAKGPKILANSAIRWIKGNWIFKPDQTRTFVQPISFELVPHSPYSDLIR